MEQHHLRQKTGKNGKTKHQAVVYFKQQYYGARTFDNEADARGWKDYMLTQAAVGNIQPVPRAKQQRKAENRLEQSLTRLAQEFVADPEHQTLSESRKTEYRLVARLAGRYTLRHFQGREGVQLLKELKHKQFATRTRGASRPGPNSHSDATLRLSPNTVRLRLTALMQLIRYGEEKLPNGAQYTPMDLKGFNLPPAHETPRRRLPTDLEFSRLLNHLGPDSPLAHFLHCVDETGCRLAEMSEADRGHVDFFTVEGQVVGGCLRLDRHKTKNKTKEPRFVPLSMFAAQLLNELLSKSTSGRAFAFRSNDAVCKQFDEACKAAGITDLQIKDFRRAFINRNKAAGVSTWDMLRVVGASTILAKPTDAEKDVQRAVGHTDSSTTATYSVADIEALSEQFTGTSRFLRVRAAVGQFSAASVPQELLVQKQQQLAKLLQEMRVLGHGASAQPDAQVNS